MDCSIASSAGCGEFATGSPYCFRYCLPDRVFDLGGVPMSATRADSSSPEVVRESTLSSVSLVEMLTTLLEDAFVGHLEGGE